MYIMSLKDLCLEIIARNMDAFYTLFMKRREYDMEFSFLQREYSEILLSNLQGLGKLKQEYLNLLFNKHLKVLRTEWFSSCCMKFVCSRLWDFGLNIEKLYVDGPFEYYVLGWLKNLKFVDFQLDCTDLFLDTIAEQCHNIEELDLTDSDEVTDDGIYSLCVSESSKVPCPKLKIIHLEGTMVTSEGIMVLLEQIPKIEVIESSALPAVLHLLHQKDLSPNKTKCYNLTELNFQVHTDCLYFHQTFKICTSMCPYLKRFHCFIVNQEDLDLCSNLTHLEDLYLYNKNESLLNINFSKLSKIRITCLSLCNVRISASDLIQNFPCLRELSLIKVAFKSLTRSHLPLLNNLTHFAFMGLNLGDSKCVSAICKMLSSSPKLKNLYMKNCMLPSREVKAEILKCCERMNELHFEYSKEYQEYLQEIILTYPKLQIKIEKCSSSFIENLSRQFRSLQKNPNVCVVNYEQFETNGEIEFEDYDDNEDDEN